MLLKNMMERKVSIGGGNITNLRLTDDIDVLAKEKQERNFM